MKFYGVFLLGVVLFAFAQTAPAQTPPCAQPEDLARLSGMIAYETEVELGNMELMVMRAPEWKPVRLTTQPGFDGHPAISPDGRLVLFTSVRNGNKDLFVIEPNGDGIKQLTGALEDEDYAQWVGDGSRIGFCVGDHVFVMNRDGRDRRQITRTGHHESPHWSSDGRRLLVSSARFGKAPEIFLIDLENNEATQLTRDDHVDTHPRWSPDETRIAFSSKRGQAWDVYVMDADGGNVRRITTNPQRDWVGGWSADGFHIVTASEFEGNWDIAVIGADGSGLLRLTCEREPSRAPVWWAAK